MKDHRCAVCHRLVMKGEIKSGTYLETMCKCKSVVYFTATGAGVVRHRDPSQQLFHQCRPKVAFS
jgi:phage FluMu protein Com